MPYFRRHMEETSYDICPNTVTLSSKRLTVVWNSLSWVVAPEFTASIVVIDIFTRVWGCTQGWNCWNERLDSSIDYLFLFKPLGNCLVLFATKGLLPNPHRLEVGGPGLLWFPVERRRIKWNCSHPCSTLHPCLWTLESASPWEKLSSPPLHVMDNLNVGVALLEKHFVTSL